MPNNNYRSWQVRKSQKQKPAAEQRNTTARGDATSWNSTLKDKPTLTTLPAEVRDIIYHYALCGSKKITTNRTPQRRITGSTRSISPDLFRTCKLFHREARPIFYSGNHFIIPSMYLQSFLSKIKFSIRHLRSITFELNDMVYAHDRGKIWHGAFLQLARLVGLRKLKLRLYVIADHLNVEEMVSELCPILENMRKARSEDAKMWTAESLSNSLTFSVEVKRSGTMPFIKLFPDRAQRLSMSQTFPKEVMAKLEEIHVAPK